jgi:hypothetical protein
MVGDDSNIDCFLIFPKKVFVCQPSCMHEKDGKSRWQFDNLTMLDARAAVSAFPLILKVMERLSVFLGTIGVDFRHHMALRSI